MTKNFRRVHCKLREDPWLGQFSQMSLLKVDTFFRKKEKRTLPKVDKIAKNRKNVVVNKWTPSTGTNASKVVATSGHVVYVLLGKKNSYISNLFEPQQWDIIY